VRVTRTVGDAPRALELGGLGFEQGAHVLVKRALRALEVGASLQVRGSAPELAIHLAAWARAEGHAVAGAESGVVRLVRGNAESGRWRGAQVAGESDAKAPGAVVERAPATWGLAARGATVEDGSPSFEFALAAKREVWADDLGALLAQALASQWDPAVAIPWDAPCTHAEELEDALVQVLTYLIENEVAALVVPARFAARVHPHYREVLQLLAIQAGDEARHIEVFTRRATLRRARLGLSTAGGQASLKTLVDEPDFALASLLLSVLGEGSFVNLLWFLHEYAPDACTKAIMKLTAQDEARHVAFGVAHLARQAREDATLVARMATAIERRHDMLRNTAGLNAEVFDALIVLAARGFEPERIAAGHAAVVELTRQMHAGRRNRLRLVGFGPEQAEALSGLHTRNFM
jgi:hypothetical protein